MKTTKATDKPSCSRERLVNKHRSERERVSHEPMAISPPDPQCIAPIAIELGKLIGKYLASDDSRPEKKLEREQDRYRSD